MSLICASASKPHIALFKKLDAKHKKMELKGRAKLSKVARSIQQVANEDLRELKDFLNSELIDSQSTSSTVGPEESGSSVTFVPDDSVVDSVVDSNI